MTARHIRSEISIWLTPILFAVCAFFFSRVYGEVQDSSEQVGKLNVSVGRVETKVDIVVKDTDRIKDTMTEDNRETARRLIELERTAHAHAAESSRLRTGKP